VSNEDTNPDPVETAWAITDPVVRLRQLGSERVFELAASARWVLGAAPECSIQIDDPSGRVSRRHAALWRTADAWRAKDLGSTNGTRHNREARGWFQIVPGDEIELGGVTLMAESRRSAELRELLCRLLGWSAARADDVDRAFGAVREMANLRAVLILRGEGALHGVARRLHHVTLRGRPFAVLGANQSGLEALQRAGDGMLCVDARALPHDVTHMVAGLLLPSTRVRLVVCSETGEDAAEVVTLLPRVATISIPPVAERAHELDRLLAAYGSDAMAELRARSLGFRRADLELVRAWVGTLDEIETFARRLVALRNWGIAGGARRLGINHGALSRWAHRRQLAT